jgi:hypothetical protein
MAVKGYNIVNVANPKYIADLDHNNPTPNTAVLNWVYDQKPFGNQNQQVSPFL